MGGSDQWGNITTGTELIRRMVGGKGFALTCPLITKSDGSKFGKSEGGNVWLDPNRTSPYKFYQYWLNTADEDAEKYIKIFTFLDRETIEELLKAHKEAPHHRILQKRLAQEVTTTVHGQEAFENAVKASEILFGNSTSEDLKMLDEKTFLDVFDGVPQAQIQHQDLTDGLNIVAALAERTGFLKSNGEARRALKENSIAVNKEKVAENYSLSNSDLMNGQFILLQRGKKNYFIIKVI
jgi:tyrosyl-tRNA synthetase